MNLNDLKPAKGSRKAKRRVGRGINAGQGRTSGRGTKGQGARSGGGKGPYFEGGQLPLVRRLPFKRGFTNLFRIEHQEVNLDQIQEHFADGGDVTPETLEAKHLIRDANKPVVILGRGELKAKVNVQAHRLSKNAEEQITKAGGTVTRLEYLLTGAKATVRLPRKEVIEALREAQKKG